jgi:hypothetical protein
MRPRPLIASPPWSAKEHKQLRTLAVSGVRPGIIAMKIGRTESAVPRGRLYKLGIPLKRSKILAESKKAEALHGSQSDRFPVADEE